MSRHHRALDRRRWKLTRRAVLERDGWRCTRCGRAGRLEVHHKVRLVDGGDEYDPDGCETLCRPCHFDRHRQRRPPSPWDRLIDDVLSSPDDQPGNEETS